jgi:hypothetical protein
MADVLGVVRDWLLPSEQAITFPNPVSATELFHWRLQIKLQIQRLELRQRLTEQVQIARGDS